MQLPDNAHSAPSRPSPTAQRLLAVRETVLATWEARVRERVHPARALAHPLLLDTLPAFYDNIIESVDPGAPRLLAIDGTNIAIEHGGERARITQYSHAALIEEYQIFRWAVFDVLHRENVVLDRDETHAIHASIDAGIQEAVEGFTLVHSGLRERFAAALTHDLRGPLATTARGLQLILATQDPKLMHAAAEKSLANVRRMSSMIEELLHTMAFHGGERLQLTMTDVDIADVVAAALGDAVLLHGARFAATGSSVSGYWDRPALTRVLENLLGNAVKYGAPGTFITIDTKQVHERLVLSVHNEGPPIPPDEQECIFQMYRRAESAKHNARQGWGIGLPYVRAVAESHGGSAGLDTSAARGTTFFVDIPLDGRLAAGAPTLETPSAFRG
ncbi:MAG TPA: HAMP domain-containing sensor histidine kinase [Telluria sp.]